MKIKYLKVTRQVLIILFTSLFSVGLFSVKPYASTFREFEISYTSNNIYATASGYAYAEPEYYVSNNVQNLMYRHVIVINFDSPVTGYFNIGMGNGSRGDIFVCTNCTLSDLTVVNYANHQFNVNGVSSCVIEYYTTTSSAYLTTFSGSWNAYTSPEVIALNQIVGYVDGVETSLSTITSNLSSMNTSLTNIYNRVNSYLPTMNSYLSSIYNFILNDYPEFSVPAWMFFRSYTSGPNTTQQRYNNILTYYSYSSTGLVLDSYDASKSFRIWQDTPLILCFASYRADFDTGLNDFSAFTFLSSNGNGLPTITDGKIDAFSVSGWEYHYIVITGSVYMNNICISFSPTVTASGPGGSSWYVHPVYFGPLDDIPDEVCALYGFEYNNTYTRLLRAIADGIGYVDPNVLQQVEVDIQSNDIYQTQIDNVLTNYFTDFNSYNTQITNNNVFDFSELPNANQVYNNLFTQVWNFPVVKWPILIILLGTVLIIILG